MSDVLPQTKLGWIERDVLGVWKIQMIVLENGSMRYFAQDNKHPAPPAMKQLGEMSLRNCDCSKGTNSGPSALHVLIENKGDPSKSILLQLKARIRVEEWYESIVAHCAFADFLAENAPPLPMTPVEQLIEADKQNGVLTNALDATEDLSFFSPSATIEKIDNSTALAPSDKKLVSIVSAADTVGDILTSDGAGKAVGDAIQGAIKFKHVALAGVKLVTTLGSKVPVVGKFFVLVDDLLTLLDNFKCNRKAAKEFSARMQEVITLLLPDLERLMNDLHSLQLQSHFNSINSTIEEASEYFQVFTKRRWLTTLLRGKEPEVKFNEYYNKLESQVNAITTALNIESLKLLTRTFNVVCDIGAKVDTLKLQSGTSGGTLSPTAMAELSELGGAEFGDMQEEAVLLLNFIKDTTEQTLELLEQGPHKMIKVLSLRKFWRDCFSSSSSVDAKEFLEFLLDYCADELNIEEDVLGSAFSSATLLAALSAVNGGGVSVLFLKQITRSVPVDATLLEAIRSICDQASLGAQRQFIVPPMPSPVLTSGARSSAPSVAWGVNTHNNIRKLIYPMEVVSDAAHCPWTSVYGPAGSGKTFRLLAAAHELKNEPSVSVLWVDLRGAVSENAVLTALSTQLSLNGVNKLENMLPAFRALLLKCCGLNATDGKPAHCTIVLDHVGTAGVAALAPVLSLIQEVMNQTSSAAASSLSVAVVSVDASPLLPYNLCASIPADNCATLEIGPLTDAEAQHLVEFGWKKTAAVAAQFVSVGESLPGRMADLALRNARYPEGLDRLTSAKMMIGSSVHSDDRLCAACLFAPLRTGYVFDYALSWHLCRDAFHNDGLAWKQSMSKLLSIGWLREKSDQGFYIPSDSMGEVSSTTVDPHAQWDKYYQYWSRMLVKVDTMMQNKDATMALALYDINSSHYTLLLTCAELSLQRAASSSAAVKVFLPSNVKAIVCQLMGHVNCILHPRFTPQRRTQICQSYATVLCDGDRLTTRKLQTLAKDDLAAVKPKFVALVEFGNALSGEARWKEAAALLRLVRECMKRISGRALKKHGLRLVLTCVLIELAGALYNMDKFSEALRFSEEALALRTAVLGDEHQLVALSMCEIADNLYRLDRRQEALDMYKDALCLLKKLLGPEHADVVQVQGSYASYLSEMGKHEEALRLLKDVHARNTKWFGESHEAVAHSLSAIGRVLSLMGNYVEALPYYESSLEVRRKLFGNTSPYVANSLNAAANVLASLNRRDEALAMYKESLQITVDAFGRNHSNYADTLGNSVVCMDSLKQLPEALQNCEQALAISERIFGENHSEVAYVRQCMGIVLQRMERYKEALAMFQSALAVLEAVSEDRAVGESLSFVGLVMLKLGRAEEALEYFRQALDVRRKALGEDHPDTKVNLTHVAHTLHLLKRYDEALELRQQVLEIRQRAHGQAAHIDTARAHHNLALTLAALDRHIEALDHYVQSLAMYREVLPDPDQHRTVADVHFHIATAHKYLEHKEQAVSAYRESVAINRRALGEDHDKVSSTLRSIAKQLVIMNQRKDALEAWQEVLAICLRVHGAAEHEDTAEALNQVALQLTALDRNAEALDYYEQSLAMYQVLYNPNQHRFVADLHFNIAIVHDKLGKKEEALSEYHKAVAIYRSALGEDHDEVANTYNAVAELLVSMDRQEEGIEFYQIVVQLLKRTPGASQANVVLVLEEVSELYSELSEHQKALDAFQEVLAIRRVMHGPDHADTADAIHNAARRLFRLGRKDEALAMFEEALTIRRKLFAPDHPDVFASMHKVAVVLTSLNRIGDTLDLQYEVLELRRRAATVDEDPLVQQSLYYIAKTLDTLNRPEEALIYRKQMKVQQQPPPTNKFFFF